MYNLETGKRIIFLLLFVITYNIYALDIEITSKSIESSFTGEYNATFDFFGGVSAAGELELNNIYTIRSGIFLGKIDDSANFRTFVYTNASPFVKVPIDFSLLWIYNGIFDYTVHSNSIIPYATYNWRKVSLSLGYNFRFTSFFGEASIFEATPVYALCINFINNEASHFGFIFGNFNEFDARFLTEYSYNFFANVRINENWQLTNSIDILQSGAVSFTETMYGIVFKMGVKYSW